MASIETKDRENVQLKQSIEVNKALMEKNKWSYKEMPKKHQKLKRKYGELYDQIERILESQKCYNRYVEEI